MRTLIPILLLILAFAPASAQVTTAFTYQGELEQGGEPATGEYDFEFVIYDTASGGAAFAGPIVADDLFVDGGLFHTELDFGPNVFGLMDLWLEIRVREGDSTGMFTALSPRQKITPAPLALNAQNVEVGAVGTEQIAVSAVVDDRIADDAISRRTLSADSVGSAEVEDESLTADDIGPDAVGTSEIAPGAVGSSELAAGAVDSNALAAGAVGSDQIAAGAVGADQIADESIPSSKLEQPYQSGSIDLEAVNPSPLFTETDETFQIELDPPFSGAPVITATLQSSQASASQLLGPIRTQSVSANGFELNIAYRTIPVRVAGKSDTTPSHLEEVNGRPAIVFRSVNTLQYVRALDSEGLRWGQPEILTPGGFIPLSVQFLDVEGHPAVVLSTNDNRLLYMRAKDANGDSWPAPTAIVDDPSIFITEVSAAIVSGVPALALVIAGEGTVYLAANSPDGSTWPSVSQAVPIADEDYGFISLQEVNGNPAISYPYQSDTTTEPNEIRYTRASDANGSSWPEPETVVAGDLFQDNFSHTYLMDFNGNPALFYRFSDYTPDTVTYRTSPYFIQASDSSGWSSPVDVSSGSDNAGLTMDAIIEDDGTAGLVWLDLDSNHLNYSRSFGGGTTFGTFKVVDVPLDTDVVGPGAATVGGEIAFTFASPNDAELRYIRNSNPNPDTFINWMAIGN